MEAQRQMRWAVAFAALAVCVAVPTKREVYYSLTPQQQQYSPAFYNLQAFQQPQQYQGYQPLQVRSVVPQYYQQQQQPFQFQPPQQYQPQQYQRVFVYNPAAYPQQPVYPAGSFLPLPLRAEEGGSSGGSTGGGWGGFNPAEYLTVLQNYWQTLTGPATQSGKPPAEQSGASPSPSGAESPAEAPETPASPEGAKKPETPAAPEVPAPAEAPATAQRFFVVSQPQVVGNPLSIPSANNGGVSTYLLLRNQPLYGAAGQQGNALRVQAVQPEQQPLQQPLQQQTVLPSVTGPMVLVRTSDNKYGLAPAGNPTRVLVSGEGIRAQDDVQVQGPGSQALAYQRFLLTRQGQYAPGFYPAPHPGVVHSLTDESISVDALRDASNATEQPTTAAPTTTPAAKDEEEVVADADEKPVSIAQVKPQAIALAGPGGVAAAAPVGTALVGPGGMALAAPSATAVAGPTGGNPAIAVPAVNTASHNADAYRKWLSKKKPAAGAANADDASVVPEFLVEYGSSTV